MMHINGMIGLRLRVIGVSDGGKTFRITEMNWEAAFKVNERTLKMTDGYSFIHDKE